MDKAFSIFGKLMLVVVIIGLLAGGGYYLGKSGKVTLTTPAPAPVAVSTTATTPLPTSAPTTTTVTAGLGPESGLSFTKYTIAVPQGWTPNHTYENQGTPLDTLSITNGAYELKIFQAATGGAMCLYPGDPPFEGPSSTYSAFVELTTKDGIMLRRGGTNGGFTLCQKGTENYGQPTGFGHMSYTTPVAADETILKQIDDMVKSLKKV